LRLGSGNGGTTSNTMFGLTALNSVTTSTNTTAIGKETLKDLSTGNGNTAIGNQAMWKHASGGSNTVVGSGAMATGSASTSTNNTVVGTNALNGNTSGGSNVAIGSAAAQGVSTGGQNVMIGAQAGNFHADGTTALTTPGTSIYIGYQSRGFNNSDANTIVIGANAIGLGANTTVIGKSATTLTQLYGTLKLPSYGTGAVTGTAAYTLQVDASGNIIEGTGGGMTSFGLTGDTGTPQTVTDGEQITFQGINGISVATDVGDNVQVEFNGGVTALADVSITTPKNGDILVYNTGVWENQANGAITALTGDVTASGPGSVAATIAADAVTNAKLDNMAASTLKGNNTGGAANPTDLTVSDVKTMLSLNNVENTALSTWAGTTNITTLGTISTGVWSGTAIGVTKGGTGLTALGTALQQLRVNAGATALEYFTPSSGGDVATDVIWDAKGDLAAGTGANTAARIAVGSDGAQLYADASTSTGLRWAPSVISPSQITSDQDDYAPTGFAKAQIVRISGDNGIRAITSLAATFDGDEKKIMNVGSYPIYFPGEHPDGTAANRISLSSDFVLYPGATVRIIYDGTSSRWRIEGEERNVIGGRNMYYSWSAGSITLGDYNDLVVAAINSGVINTTVAGTSTLPAGWVLSSSTSSNGGGALYFTKTAVNYSYFGAAHLTFSALVSLPTLSDGTDTYTATARIVAGANNTTIGPNNAVGIRYTHGTNSGKWEGYSISGAGAVSTADLGVTVTAGQAYLLRVELDKAIGEARFYIDGVFTGRVTASMPTAFAVGSGVIMLKSAGTTAREINVHNMSAKAIYP